MALKALDVFHVQFRFHSLEVWELRRRLPRCMWRCSKVMRKLLRSCSLVEPLQVADGDGLENSTVLIYVEFTVHLYEFVCWVWSVWSTMSSLWPSWDTNSRTVLQDTARLYRFFWSDAFALCSPCLISDGVVTRMAAWHRPILSTHLIRKICPSILFIFVIFFFGKLCQMHPAFRLQVQLGHLHLTQLLLVGKNADPDCG